MNTKWFPTIRLKPHRRARAEVTCLSCRKKTVIDGTMILPISCSGCGADLYSEEILFIESIQSDLVRVKTAS